MSAEPGPLNRFFYPSDFVGGSSNLTGSQPAPIGTHRYWSFGLEISLIVMHLIQDHYGHLSAAHLAALAAEMELRANRSLRGGHLYSHFDVVKEGPAPPAVTVRICNSLSCAMAGAEALLKKLPGILGKDVRVVRAPCMGACDRARVHTRARARRDQGQRERWRHRPRSPHRIERMPRPRYSALGDESARLTPRDGCAVHRRGSRHRDVRRALKWKRARRQRGHRGICRSVKPHWHSSIWR